MVKIADRNNEGAQDERAREQLTETVRELNDTARQGVGKVAAEGRDLLERGAHAARTTGNGVMHLWAEVGGEQLRCNLETMTRLAQARSLPELIGIHGDYVVQTMSRVAELMTRQLETTGRVPSLTAR